MSGMLASTGLMHLPLDYTQDLAPLGVGVLALFVLSAVMILAVAVSDVVSHHLAHGH